MRHRKTKPVSSFFSEETTRGSFMVIRDVNDLYVPGVSTFFFFFLFFSRAAGSLLAVNASVYISFVALGELPKCTAAQIIKKEREREWQGPIELYPCVLVYTRFFFLYICIYTQSTHTSTYKHFQVAHSELLYGPLHRSRLCLTRGNI